MQRPEVHFSRQFAPCPGASDILEAEGAMAWVQQGSILWQPPAHQQQDKGFLAQLVGRVFEAGSAFPVQGIVPCIALAAGVEPDGLRVSMAHLVQSDGYLSEMVLDNERTSPAWRALISGKLNVEDLPELQTSIGLCTARKSTRQSSAAPARRTHGPAKRGCGMGPTGARVLSPTRDRVAQRLITPPTYVAEPPENPAVSISSIAELYPYKQMPCGNWSFSPPVPKQFAVTARVLNNLAKRAAAGESAVEEDLRSAEKMVCLVLGLDYAEVSRDAYNKSEHAWRRRFIINIVDRLSAMQPEVKNTFPTYWSK
ncbi:hypothetical protein PLESTM_000921200 [Pleodorina starrii]|nr:hypothetical protein PLESTM_000921200 [Pleodorina starrii]